MLKCENQSMKIEVWKQVEKHLSASIPYWLSTVPGSQRVTVSKQFESLIVGSWTQASTNTII